MDSNQELIEHLENTGVLKTPKLKQAMEKNPREFYIRTEDKRFAYGDSPLPIGYGQTISQPTTVFFILELLEVKQGQKVMEIGTGSGWQTAILASVVGERGKVFSFEIVPQLSEFAKENLKEFDYKNIALFACDFEKKISEIKPLDRVVSGAAFSEIPQSLKTALKIGGKLVAPTQQDDIRVITRTGVNKFKEDIFPGFVFVPVTH